VKKHRSESVVGPLVFALLLLRLCGCAGEPRAAASHPRLTPPEPKAVAPEPPTSSTATSPAGTTVVLPPAPPEPPAPAMPVTRVLESGEGWRRIKVSGEAEDGVTGAVRRLRDEYYAIDGRAAIARTSLPVAAQRALAIGLGAPPSDGDDEMIIISGQVIDVVEGRAISASACRDEEKTFGRSFPVDRTYNFHKASEGDFAGSAELDTRINGSVTAQVRYSIRHAACVPFVVVRGIDLAGRTDVVAKAAVDATFKAGVAWDREVYAPVLGAIILPGTTVPVVVKAPITVGIDATAAAELHERSGFEAHGRFDVRCNAGGCAGTRSGSHGFVPGDSPSAAVVGRAEVTPWVEGGVRAYVMDEGVQHAEVGVRARLVADLWGYAGNACGDADHNGSNETITAATIDLGIGIDVVAKRGALGRDEAPWFWNVGKRHLAFWSVGDNAVSPLFYVQDAHAPGSVTLRAGMRPCWPYADVVTYLVTWSDGATDLIKGAPGTLLTVTHSFASREARLLRLDALTDAAGRTLGASTLRSVSFLPPAAGQPAAVAHRRPHTAAPAAVAAVR
jgi:hypothetical protein